MLAPLVCQAEPDALIDGARQCTQYFPQQERANNIPTHLLAAIATTESGRWHENLQMSVPWPWTINVEGKGYYFATKAEAIAHTQNFLAKGYDSIDVGCMQVNLKHHPKAFADLNQAFDPATNVAYAAKFLSTNYASLGDWIKATAAYHSRTPVHGNRYLVDIEKSWNRIVSKVAAARASKSGNAQMAAALGGSEVNQPAVKVSAAPTNAKPAKLVVATAEAPRAHSARVIKVSDAMAGRDNGASVTRERDDVLVVRVAPVGETVKVADASAVAAPVPQGSTVRRVTLDNPARAQEAASGPNFVFAN